MKLVITGMNVISADLIKEWAQDQRAITHLLTLRKARSEETLEIMVQGLEKRLPKREEGAIARAASLREHEISTGRQISIPAGMG